LFREQEDISHYSAKKCAAQFDTYELKCLKTQTPILTRIGVVTDQPGTDRPIYLRRLHKL